MMARNGADQTWRYVDAGAPNESVYTLSELQLMP
jgi:hypothetical protein